MTTDKALDRELQRKSRMKANNDALRERSGTVKINDTLTSFLYDLMRDHLTPGKVEGILTDCHEPDVTYTNGYLASYALDVANRLKGVTPIATIKTEPTTVEISLDALERVHMLMKMIGYLDPMLAMASAVPRRPSEVINLLVSESQKLRPLLPKMPQLKNPDEE